MPNVLHLKPAALERRGETSRLSLPIGEYDEPLWFESADLPLAAGGEGPASALLMAAAARNLRLGIADPVSSNWFSNVTRLMQTWQQWWGYPPLSPETTDIINSPRVPAPGRALCFTGGVDSFHTLLHASPKPDILAFVHGYDIPLSDETRMAAWLPAFHEIAGESGAKPVILRTNLRNHPAFHGSDWERAHGGALAAAGHHLADHAGTLLIASSVPTHYENIHWGSHWQLDELWSSDRLKIVHHGAELSRFGKVRAIVDSDLAAKHLRVCWENRTAAGNCSRCDKCLCTMILILASGGSEASTRFTTFDWPPNLATHLNQIPWTRFIRTYREVLECNVLDPRLIRAIRALLKRTAGHVPFLQLLRRLTRIAKAHLLD